jgi:hypothetical protein
MVRYRQAAQEGWQPGRGGVYGVPVIVSGHWDGLTTTLPSWRFQVEALG